MHPCMYVLQAHSCCWYLIGLLRSCDVVPTCLFNLSLFGPVRRSNRSTEKSNQATQIALQLVTHTCLSASIVSKDNSIQPDMQICCYLSKSETENVFYRSIYFHTSSFWNSLHFSTCLTEKCALVTLRFKQQPISSFIVKASFFSTVSPWLSGELRVREIWCILIICSNMFCNQ